jgi:hypothetical protein
MHDTLPGAAARYGDLLDVLYRKYPEDVVRVGSATCGEFGPEIGVPSPDPWGSLWVRPNDEHSRGNWARLSKKIYEVDPLRCPRCGQANTVLKKWRYVNYETANTLAPSFHKDIRNISSCRGGRCTGVV